MELNLLRSGKIKFRNSWFPIFKHESKKTKVDSISKRNDSTFALTFDPVNDERSNTCYKAVHTNPFRENYIDFLFGETDDESAKEQLKGRPGMDVTTHLTLTSSNTGKLMIETKDDKVDIFEGFLNIQETLPPNSIEFNLFLSDFHYSEDLRNDQRDDEMGLEFNWKGLKLTRNEVGAASLEITDISLPEDISWKLWTLWSEKWPNFFGYIAINVRLEIDAVAELYKRNFSGSPSPTTEVRTATDMVILVGGNKDKEKAIKCHKSILSEMSPVFAAMFQTDMLEAKEGALEIVDFSEAVIRALMEYAYRRNVEEALESSEMTLELLQFADKYEMKDLTNVLLHIIWSMPFSWFSVDVAFKLFFFARNAGEDLSQAKKKAWKTLKWYAETYPDELMESTESVEFLCENPRAMMELLVLLFNKCN